MRGIILVLIITTGCSTQANHIGNPLLLPVTGITTALGNAAYQQRRGQVEVFVKSNHSAILSDIAVGGGDTVARAMDIAGISTADRPARLIQMRTDLALYETSAEALVVALMVYST